MSKLFLILIIGLMPALLWGGYFWHNNPSRQSFKEILGIFSLGMLSVIPVLMFHKWILLELMIELKQDWNLLNHPFLSALTELSLLLLFIVIFVSFFGLLSTIITRIKERKANQDHLEKISLHKKLYNLSPILIFFGLFMAIEAFSTGLAKTSFISTLAGSIIVFAVLEEYFKYAINPFLVNKKIHSVGTAMVNALYVGLAFAFVENLLFFYVNYNTPEFYSIVLYRSVFTSLLHVCASGILGYFYGLTLFSNALVASYEIEKGQYKLPFWLRSMVKKDTAYKSLSVSRGFFLASIVHAGFNLFLNLNLKIVASLTVITLAIGVIIVLRSKQNQIQYGLIGTQTMPTIDFEKLRLQIAVLKEQKLIQQERYG